VPEIVKSSGKIPVVYWALTVYDSDAKRLDFCREV
jgi:hypothetical protein